jgi:hypothetical protein
MDGVGEVHDLYELVVMVFDVGLRCIFCAWCDLFVLLLCNDVVQCLLFGRSYPLPLPLHVPLLCFIGVGKVLVDQLCPQAWPRGIISCLYCIKEGFFQGKSCCSVLVEHGLSVVG